MLPGMEFNVNAADAGARLRTGVGQHTLSVGDHDVTLMINGSRVELQRFALAVVAETKIKIRVDGFIDGNEAYGELLAENARLRGQMDKRASPSQ